MGIVFPHSANEIFYTARQDQQPDASRIMNTGINLGSSLGTAILGLILILGGFSAFGLAFNQQQPVNSQENIIGVHALFEKLEIKGPGDIDEKQTAVNIQKVDTMKNAFNIITLVLICSLILSLFIPPHRLRRMLKVM